MNVVVREMAITRAELLRTLALLPDINNIHDSEGRIEFEYRGAKIHVSVELEKNRQIGSLRLPLTRLSFDFDKLASGDVPHFMHRFDLYFRRGGG